MGSKNKNWRPFGRQFVVHYYHVFLFVFVWYHNFSKNKPFARMIYFALFFARVYSA